MRLPFSRHLWHILGLCAILGFVTAVDDLVYKSKSVYMGQYFEEFVGNNFVKEGLPKWLSYNNSRIFGVPQFENVPATKTEHIKNGTTSMLFLHYNVTENKLCGDKQAIFLEIIKEDLYSEYSNNELKDISYDIAVTMDVPVSELRLFPADYRKVWRDETNEIFSNVEDIRDDADDRLVVTWILGCDRFDENDNYAKTASVIHDNDYEFRVVEGIQNTVSWTSPDLEQFSKDKDLIESVTEYPLLRSTRLVNEPPKKLKSLPSYNCVRGKKCILNIPNDTFIDELPPNRLLYSVHAIEHDENFLYAQFPRMQGVALKAGSYKFRLEARDTDKQPASAPFMVTVTDEPERDYAYELIFDKDFKAFDGIQTCTLIDRLASVLRLDADKLRITELKAGKIARQSIAKFNVIDHVIDGKCNVGEIKKVNRVMTTRNDVLPKFVSQIGQQFFIRSVHLELFGNCNNDTPITATSVKPVHQAGVNVPETPNVKVQENDSMLRNYLLPVALIALFAVITIFAIIYCCLFRKPNKKERKALTYVTRGQPVVFPNEVSHDDDINSVHVPMLAKDERPPLKPLEITTIHENPLYRAPTNVRTSVSTTNSQLNTTSTPRSTVAPNQRLPPSYVAP